jgi:hypothetical protein
LIRSRLLCVAAAEFAALLVVLVVPVAGNADDASDARAGAGDGAYVTESFGVASASGGFAAMLGTPLHLRLAIGMRLGHFALEPWILSDMQIDREGATLGIVGGDPRPGAADINSMGLDAKYIVDLDHHVALFARGGPLVGDGTGALTGYHGRGIGAAAGAQLTGKVRALGFLWAPLFFVKRGPMATGALLIDAGYDFYFLRMPGAPPIDARIGHISVGFAVGTAF